MTQLNETFSTDTLPEGGNFEPVPASDYTVKIENAGLNDTKAGNGQYIKLEMVIEGPSHEGRKLFDNINIRNPNPQAETIARQTLGQIMRASGLATLSDTDQLVGLRLVVKATVKDDPQYGPSNDIKSYKAIEGSAPPSPQQQTSQQGQPSRQGASAPPWAK